MSSLSCLSEIPYLLEAAILLVLVSSSYRKPGLWIPLQPRLDTKWSNLGPQGGLGNLDLSVEILFYPSFQITPNKPEKNI